MLLSKRCPYTQIINFFDAAEPHIAIGSISRGGTLAGASGFTWRFYAEEVTLCGRAPDAFSAERSLRASLLDADRRSELVAH